MAAKSDDLVKTADRSSKATAVSIFFVHHHLQDSGSKDHCSLHNIDAKTSVCAGSNYLIYFKM